MSRNRYQCDDIDGRNSPNSMVSEEVATTPAKQLIRMGRTRSRTKTYGFSPSGANAEDTGSINNEGNYNINGDLDDEVINGVPPGLHIVTIATDASRRSRSSAMSAHEVFRDDMGDCCLESLL